MKKQKVVMKYTCLPDFEKLGFHFSVVYFVGHKSKALLSFIKGNSHVNNAYRISNCYSCMLECVFSKMEEIEKFEQELRSLKCGYRLHFITEEIMREGFMP